MSKIGSKKRGLGQGYVSLAIGLSIAWLGCLAWLGASLHPPAIWARLYELRMASLNEIGDFVAGAFAPIGVVWLIITVLQQKTAVADARAEFEETQQASYFIALFDRRYDLLVKIRQILGDEPTPENRAALFRATEMASLLFGTEVPALLLQYQNKFLRFTLLNIEIGRLQRAPVEDVDAIGRMHEEQNQIVVWIYDHDRRTKLLDGMLSFLKAPTPPPSKHD